MVSWVSRMILLVPVQRAFRPGAKHDEMPVLIGPQGIGKSTAFRLLLPPESRADWFSDGLNMYAPTKERAEALLGRIIVEVLGDDGDGPSDLGEHEDLQLPDQRWSGPVGLPQEPRAPPPPVHHRRDLE